MTVDLIIYFAFKNCNHFLQLILSQKNIGSYQLVELPEGKAPRSSRGFRITALTSILTEYLIELNAYNITYTVQSET